MVEFRYRPDIDGLRAVAVGMVVLFHAGLGFSGGFVGVDVFFVISGFLITGLITTAQQADTFRLSDFWGRRIRRIIPAASLVCSVSLAIGWLLLLPEDLDRLAESLIAQQAMCSNVYFWQNTGYFDGESETMPLLHTWSLAVEEQFYLGFPLLLMALRRSSNRIIVGTFLTLIAGSLLLSEWGVRQHPNAAFFLLPSRAWELLLGAILVYCPKPLRLRRAWLEFGAWGGFAMVIAAGVFYGAATKFPGMAALVPCLGTFAVIYFNSSSSTSLGRMLSNRMLVFFGLISYSLYLWHWPMLAFLRYRVGIELSPWQSGGTIMASLALAVVSWKFVEMPMRKSGLWPGLKKPALGAVGSAIVMIGVAFAIDHQQGCPWRYPENVRILAAPMTASRKFESRIADVRSGRLPVIGAKREADNTPPDFIVWGDSHAMVLGDCMDSLASHCGLTGVIAVRLATIPVVDVWRPGDSDPSGDALKWNDAVLEFIRQENIRHVILVGRWAVNIEGRPDGTMDSLIARRGSATTSREEARAAFRDGLSHTFDELESMGAAIRVLKQVPVQTINPQRALVRSASWGLEVPKGVSLSEHRARQQNANDIIDQLAAERPAVTTLDLAEAFFDRSGHSRLGNHAGSFYRDCDHLSDHGVNELIRPYLLRLLTEIGSTAE
ncbi:MAG: acyltransferase family protein [Planctomycetaceae bacterium]